MENKRLENITEFLSEDFIQRLVATKDMDHVLRFEKADFKIVKIANGQVYARQIKLYDPKDVKIVDSGIPKEIDE